MNQDFIYVSGEMEGVVKLILKAAMSTATVLLTGESGTGKEKLAQLLHQYSIRSAQPFVAFNCAALPESLLESELFGIKKGAYTSAEKDRKGLIETANGGTLFIDEIGDLPSSAQMKLLRFLQERMFTPLGGTTPMKVDVRIVTATNKEPENLIREGTFREDLYYRLNVIRIHIPPIRHRRSDIRPLVEYFVDYFSKQNKKLIRGISADAWKKILRYTWYGNVREIKNIVERAVVLSNDELLSLEDFQFGETEFKSNQTTEFDTRKHLSKQTLSETPSHEIETRTNPIVETTLHKDDDNQPNLDYEAIKGIVHQLIQKQLSLLKLKDLEPLTVLRYTIESKCRNESPQWNNEIELHLLTRLFEMEWVFRAIIRANGNKSKAATLLKMSEKNIRDRIKKWQNEFGFELTNDDTDCHSDYVE